MQVNGEKCVLDPLSIKHTAGDKMCLLEFGKDNPPITNNNANNGTDARNDRLDEDGVGMDE